MAEQHSLLRRQLKRHFAGEPPSEEGWSAFLADVDAAYREFDDDRAMLERTLELSSNELLQANSEMLAVLNAFPDLFMWLDGDGVITKVKVGRNDGLVLFRDNLVGRRVQDIPDAEVGRQFSKGLGRVRATGEIVSIEYELARDRSFFEARMVPLMGNHTLAIVRNITARKMAERQVAKQNEDLEAKVRERTAELNSAKLAAESANEAKSVFLANMSHELRTPLHAILSFASFGLRGVRRGVLDKIEHYFVKIDASGKTLLALVNEVLDLAKLESGMTQLAMEPAGLCEAVDQVADEFHSLLSERKLALEWQRPDAEAVAIFDVVRIQQVVRNLLGNAIKFSPKGGKISLRVTESAGALKVSVADQGVGIPDAELASIFEKFVQSSATSTSAGGTGLGLAICQEIINGHGGSIWAEHGASGGAVLVFELPAASRGLAAK